MGKKNILAIIGSASSDSTNLKLVEKIRALSAEVIHMTIFDELKSLPHFDPRLSSDNPPELVIAFRKAIEEADGIIICTPEYVFSIPSGLKNAIEWCVATTVFQEKPCGLITASANGQKGHEELQLIMKTLMANFNNQTALLINGVKGRFNIQGDLTQKEVINRLDSFIGSFVDLVNS